MVRWSSNWCIYLNMKTCNVLYSGEKNTNCDYFMSLGLDIGLVVRRSVSGYRG